MRVIQTKLLQIKLHFVVVFILEYIKNNRNWWAGQTVNDKNAKPKEKRLVCCFLRMIDERLMMRDQKENSYSKQQRM